MCSNLTSPYVALSYKICDSNGNIQGYAMELTYPEFQVYIYHLCLTKNKMSNVSTPQGIFNEVERHRRTYGQFITLKPCGSMYNVINIFLNEF